MTPDQLTSGALVIKLWGVEASAYGLPAVVALTLVLVVLVFMRRRRS
jgi:hypothetical protein